MSRAVAGQALGARLAGLGGRAAPPGRASAGCAWRPGRPTACCTRYYLDQGFELLRIVDLPHRNSGALFQRPAAAHPEPEESRR
ncbi:hypothetical protein LT493_08985 [Streptomyces tricolor]|nr:hypothetical protein [Streptomyces tricolor]